MRSAVASFCASTVATSDGKSTTNCACPAWIAGSKLGSNPGEVVKRPKGSQRVVPEGGPQRRPREWRRREAMRAGPQARSQRSSPRAR